ncbi:hypothetical protein TUM12370_21100 [Salmonella enterica subsp. enterica serovar Choleraesuis]|nr:hypothetical protein TUM12370_21100 [Salmonella enterica subsp. enterica serovar Choleraesuis]
MKKLSVIFSSFIALGISFSACAAWPPETGAKVPGNALEYPTRLEPLNTSLEKLLNSDASVISSYAGETGPVVTLRLNSRYIICMVKGAGIGSDQKVATSKCYAMN